MVRRSTGLFAIVLLALSLGACKRMATNENGNTHQQTDFGVEASSSGSYEATQQIPSSGGGSVPVYGGQWAARARFDGSTGQAHARTVTGVRNNGGVRGYYGAAFYFPPGTFTGAQPNQTRAIDIMGWKDDAGNTGGIRVRPDHRAVLMKGATEVDPGNSFTLREGCWNWLVVRQQGRSTNGTGPVNFPTAENEVFLNGRSVLDSNASNTFGRRATEVRFGLVSVDAGAQSPTLDVYVDDAYVSHDELVPPGANACRPNILFIVTDDQRIGTPELLDGSGQPWMKKTLDWFGGTTDADGNPVSTAFSDAFATTSLCCPARASIFTGRYAHNHGVMTNNPTQLLPNHPGYDPVAAASFNSSTLQHQLQDAGYWTGMVGKYLNKWVALGGGGSTGKPLQNPPDFDEWTVFDNGPYYPEHPSLPNEPACPDEGNNGLNGWGVDCVNESLGGGASHLTEAPPGTYATTYAANEARDFINNRAGQPSKPWFLYVAPTAPHTGWPEGEYTTEPSYTNLPVPPWTRNSSSLPEADVTDKPPSVQDNKYSDDPAVGSAQEFRPAPDYSTWPQLLKSNAGRDCYPPKVTAEGIEGYTQCVESVRAAQLRMLKSVDDLVDGIFDTLRDTNQDEDTLAFFISDNGFVWNEHALFAKPHPYLEGVRVPMYMRWPNHHLESSTDSSLVANIDLAPTALAAARASPPAGLSMDGADLLAAGRQPRDRLLVETRAWASLVKQSLQFTEYYTSGGTAPLLWDPKYLSSPDSPPGSHVREYYDLSTEGGLELTNLLHDGNPAVPPGTDPSTGVLPAQLSDARACAGHGEVSGRPACP